MAAALDNDDIQLCAPSMLTRLRRETEMRSKLLAGLLASVLAFGAGTADAALLTYSNRADFLADTGATSASGVFPSDQRGASSIRIGQITYSAAAAATPFDVGLIDSAHFPGQRLLSVTGRDQLNIRSHTAPIYSLGFDFVELENDPGRNGRFIDSTFTVTLLNGASNIIDMFTFNAPNDVAAFVGVWSTDPFDRIRIRETVGAAENELFGQVYTGRTALDISQIPVPEPAAGLVMGMSLLMLAGVLRRRTRQAQS
ncbi:hypothetical protein J8J14_07175 [Roseomonas sp. SSH11]|uniref:PEP-CTERM protein-sorting domain-containing protein n=1 Tax=Pararoseomonas baculiformis TaxID=2820812 RepID=A0ABS4AC28_9PROT|nr:hypothetical protein [Pararoseomonas baculiformis]MBP0444561.1 hypothetical protein [Pararoseomonas baculiformis]